MQYNRKKIKKSVELWKNVYITWNVVVKLCYVMILHVMLFTTNLTLWRPLTIIERTLNFFLYSQKELNNTAIDFLRSCKLSIKSKCLLRFMVPDIVVDKYKIATRERVFKKWFNAILEICIFCKCILQSFFSNKSHFAKIRQKPRNTYFIDIITNF